MLEWTYRQIRRFVIAVLGMTLLLIGVALLALPGPGLLFIIASLAVLAIEFVWARQLLKRLRQAIPDGALGADRDAQGDRVGPIARSRRALGRLARRVFRRGRVTGSAGTSSSSRKNGRPAESR